MANPSSPAPITLGTPRPDHVVTVREVLALALYALDIHQPAASRAQVRAQLWDLGVQAGLVTHDPEPDPSLPPARMLP